ncbi:hypothetical protein WL09_03425 [Burkholderia ubonensis]|nr:hypothetical protein WL09_03425 [Burkholderia ubonensis]
MEMNAKFSLPDTMLACRKAMNIDGHGGIGKECVENPIMQPLDDGMVPYSVGIVQWNLTPIY